MSEKLCYSTATEIARKIRTKELTPTEVIDTFLDRIEKLNGSVNAFTYVREEEAKNKQNR